MFCPFRRHHCRGHLDARLGASPNADSPCASKTNRSSCYGTGVTLVPDSPPIIVDGEAIANQKTVETQYRQKRADDYYRDQQLQHEATILTLVVATHGKNMLFPLLGDPIKNGARVAAKLPLLIDYNKSLVGKAGSDLLQLIMTWDTDDVARKPWCVLEALGVPMDAQHYMRYARSKTLRASSENFRRNELKYGDLYFEMCRLATDDYSDEY